MLKNNYMWVYTHIHIQVHLQVHQCTAYISTHMWLTSSTQQRKYAYKTNDLSEQLVRSHLHRSKKDKKKAKKKKRRKAETNRQAWSIKSLPSSFGLPDKLALTSRRLAAIHNCSCCCAECCCGHCLGYSKQTVQRTRAQI